MEASDSVGLEQGPTISTFHKLYCWKSKLERGMDQIDRAQHLGFLARMPPGHCWWTMGEFPGRSHHTGIPERGWSMAIC